MLLSWFSEMSKLVCNFTSVFVSTPTHEMAFSQMKHSLLKFCSRITNVHLHDVMWTGISKWERNINPLVEQIQAHVSHWSGSSGYSYLRVQSLVSNSTDIFECSGLCNILHHSMWPACLERLSTHHLLPLKHKAVGGECTGLEPASSNTVTCRPKECWKYQRSQPYKQPLTMNYVLHSLQSVCFKTLVM